MRFFKFCLWKAYFEKGYALTSYVKYVIALFGLASQDLKITLIAGVIYGFVCFFLGWIWFHYHIVDAEIEVQNQFNLFVKQMRKRKV